MRKSFRSNAVPATVGLTCVLSIAIAAELGRWLCTGCYISPAGTPESAVAVSEAIQALTSIQRETLITPMWRPQDTVTICDGANCIDLKYTGSPLALWILKPGTIPYRDSGRTYKNAQVSQPATIAGAFAYKIEIAPIDGWVDTGPRRIPTVRVIQYPQQELPASFASSFSWGAENSSDAFWWPQGGSGGGGVCEPLCYYEN